MRVETLKKVREKIGWTRYKMAKELGISQTQYTYLETKAKSMQTTTLVKLGKICEKEGISISQLWGLLSRESV